MNGFLDEIFGVNGPFERTMQSLEAAMDRTFGGTSVDYVAQATDGYRVWDRFRVDKEPERRRVVITIEVPGLGAEDITVQLQGQRLLVETKPSPVAGPFKREFRVAKDTDPSKLKCRVKNGVLTIEVEAKPPELEPPSTRIPVQG